MSLPPDDRTGPDLADELDLVRRSGLVLRVGRLSLASGTGSYRVKHSMARIAHALGIERHQALVTLTEITTTSHRGRSFRTEVTEIRDVGVNAERLSLLQRLVDDVGEGPISPEDLEARLDVIEGTHPRYPPLLSGLWAGAACASFAFLLGEGWVEMLGALAGAFAGQVLRRTMLARRYNQIGVTMASAALACAVYLGVVTLIGLTHPGGSVAAGFVAAVLFLVPGFPLVTASLDLARLDISAGLARLTYGMVIVSSAALVVWVVAHTLAVPEPVSAADPDLARASLQLLASFCGVLGFALMFNSPLSMGLVAAAIGALPNTARLLAVESGVAPALAAAGAALVVGLVAAVVAPRMRVPRITVSVPAVVIMVPGSTAYLAMVGLGDGDTLTALAFGVQACLSVLGIAVGLALARMLSDREWAFER